MRWYDPDYKFWLSPDPIGEKGGLNLYGFVGNNPVSGIDPWGLKKFNNCMVAIVSGHYGWVLELATGKKKDYSDFTRIGPLSCRSGETNDEIPEQNRISSFPTPTERIGNNKYSDNDEYNNGGGGGGEGYKKLLRKALNAAKKEAQKLAKDCKCQCKEIKLFIKCQVPDTKGEKQLFKYKQEIFKRKCNKIYKRYKCKKNAKK